MTPQVADAIPYAAGAAVTSIAIVGQATDVTFWLQAGMAGIVVLLLLKVFPFLMKHLEEKDKRHQIAMQTMHERHQEAMSVTQQRHEETIQRICDIHDARNKEWQRIVQDKGICPIDKSDPTKREIGGE